MKTYVKIVPAVMCLMFMLSAGCVRLWQDNIEIKTYMVEVLRDKPPAEQALGEKLWIEPVTVLPPYNVRNLILRKSDVEFSTSYYTELLMSPAENFRNSFYTWFSASGLFRHVSIAERNSMSHRMVVNIMEFYGDTQQEEAVLRIKVTLFDEQARGMSVLLSREYRQSVALAETRADELVRAYNRALTRILADCEKDVLKALQ